MKTNNFKIGQLVRIIDIYNLDVISEITNEQDIFLGDVFEIVEIEGEGNETDLIVRNEKLHEDVLIGAFRFEDAFKEYEFWVKTGKVGGKKVVNIFEVADLIGLSVSQISKYQIEQNKQLN